MTENILVFYNIYESVTESVVELADDENCQ